MKKLVYLLILCMLLTSFMSACNGGSADVNPDNGESAGDITETGDTAQTEETTETTHPDWKLSLSRDDVTFVQKNDYSKIYDGTVPMEEVIWGSFDPNVATFQDGVVTAVGKGETVVWAEYDGIRVSCVVYCKLGTGSSSSSGGSSVGKREPVLEPPTAQVVDSSFFDDAVFIGDSISLKLSYYAASSGELGKAKFLVVGSYSVCNAIDDGLKLTYQGQSYQNVEDALAATGAKKLFIMLGMNDIARGDYGYVDGAIKNWGTLVDMLRSKCPDLTIYIQSMTPVWTGGEKGRLNNDNVDDYNAKLKNFAESHGCKFIDIAPYMKDSTNGLATKFCSDSYVHLTDAGAKTWIKVLKAYTGY